MRVYAVFIFCALLAMIFVVKIAQEFESTPEPSVSTKGIFHDERYYQDKINEVLQGQTEFKNTDNTRVDILTEDVAWEVDFAHKWYEAVGQAVHYAMLTGRKPGIILIAEDEKSEEYVARAKRAVKITGVMLDLGHGRQMYHITLLIYRSPEKQ